MRETVVVTITHADGYAWHTTAYETLFDAVEEMSKIPHGMHSHTFESWPTDQRIIPPNIFGITLQEKE